MDGESLVPISSDVFMRFITVAPLLNQELSIYLILALLEQNNLVQNSELML